MGNNSSNCLSNKNVVYPNTMDGPPPEDCELILTLDEPKPQPKGKVQLKVVQVKNPAYMSLQVCIRPVEKQFGPSFFDGREMPATGGSGLVNYSQMPPLPKGKILRSRGGVLINGNTGEMLVGMSEKKMLRPASLTKIMTAKLVLDLVQKYGEAMLDEVAQCPAGMYVKGTSANLTCGDSISVRSLLHGLMLPSGNDAGYTLAVHCGPKCEEYATLDPASYQDDNLRAYDAFVRAMNNEAKRMKLKQTRFENPHGARGRYTKKRHMSCAHDMAVLLAEGLKQHPMINEMMMTIRFTCMVMSKSGEKQQKTWYNTHGLLGRNGVHGGKTGVTHKGHYCLATQVRHEGHLLIAVVLECKNKRDCYADTQRLLNYGWRKLGIFDSPHPNDTAVAVEPEGGGRSPNLRMATPSASRATTPSTGRAREGLGAPGSLVGETSRISALSSPIKSARSHRGDTSPAAGLEMVPSSPLSPFKDRRSLVVPRQASPSSYRDEYEENEEHPPRSLSSAGSSRGRNLRGSNRSAGGGAALSTLVRGVEAIVL